MSDLRFKCDMCGEDTNQPVFVRRSLVYFQSSEGFKANCPKCGSFIRFVKREELTRKQVMQISKGEQQ